MRLGIRAKDKQVAVAANTPCRPPELHRHDDEADEPEDEEDEGADEDDRGQQAALVDEGEEEDDEGDDEGGDGYVVGEVPGRERVSLAWGGRGDGGGWAGGPWHGQAEGLLGLDERGKDADDAARGDEHDEHPEVELPGGPLVAVDLFRDAALVDVRVGGGGRGHDAGGGRGGFGSGGGGGGGERVGRSWNHPGWPGRVLRGVPDVWC